MLRGKIIENGKYVVFNNGSVWVRNWHNSGKPQKAKLCKDTNGYLICYINKKRTLVHRLVAECFLPNPNKLPIINHKNEVKNDNRVENLEWCTYKYNNTYGTCIERQRAKQINHPKKSKPVFQYTKEGVFIKEWQSAMEIQRQLGYNQGCISDCCNGKQKTAYDYLWTHTPLLLKHENNGNSRGLF